MRICTLGDVLLDVIVRPAGPSVAGRDVAARTRVGPGGQAVNVAAWAARLGGAARVVAARSQDAPGRIVADELASRGVELVGPVRPSGTGCVVAVVDDAGERTMMSDRGVSPTLRPDELRPEWFADVDRLHVTGYALLAEPMADAASIAADLAREAGARVSLDLSAADMIRAVGAGVFLRRLARLDPEVVFGTEPELEALGGAPAVPVVVVKRGARGVSVRWRAGRREVPPPDGPVVDTTGAGDAFAAGFLLATTLDAAVDGATAAARECIATMGAVPTAAGDERVGGGVG